MNLSPLHTIVASTVAGTAAGFVAAAGFVNLQGASPGTAQTGHVNVSGNVLAGRFGSGVQPTLARVQVKETGTLQGVRAESNSGVAVFGKSTAATGLGAGGYFTSSSVGGRGIVGDAQSATGTNVGGLFYSRGDAGFGVQGIQRKASGTGTGVFGQAYSPDGNGLAAQNVASGNRLVAGSGNDSLQTSGRLPRHEYVNGTPAAMVPIAYGYINTFGSIFHGSGNFTATRVGTGQVEIDVAGVSASVSNLVTVATAAQFSGDEFASFTSATTGDVRIIVWNLTSGGREDSDLTFVIYRAQGNGAMMPEGLARPDMGGARDTEEWQRRDPRAFQVWLRKIDAWNKANAQPANFPGGEGEEGSP